MKQPLAKDASMKAITLKEDESLHDARNAMLSYGIDRVVIVTEEYQPIGIITEKDAMRLIMDIHYKGGLMTLS
jgi:CBS domain-containing protein